MRAVDAGPLAMADADARQPEVECSIRIPVTRSGGDLPFITGTADSDYLSSLWEFIIAQLARLAHVDDNARCGIVAL
jgi:hypothetical protein